ncbi:methyltransferase, FxLD system [Pseudofrankia sp. BMG5.36]|uniref:methyltransferase, FxLD system n=1 Tax=Pseudofrankia sp. BMG5.36 TaxID=1834512 RepID=UPI0008D958E2|nr:methyltransferase, FxLD system [Pseudofrankia sp. BMG5.36]OHV58751.1 methyltransferase, FxLD system [Pseudofrankia sp. BMG5.36]
MAGTGWQQIQIEFADRVTAQDVAVRDLLPVLIQAEAAGQLRDWWFVRKRPWRLRFRAPESSVVPLPALLDDLAERGRIISWARGVYEPEERAFGGPEAMDRAHLLFHADSLGILKQAARHDATALGRREAAALLCSAMMRAAGLDWYEQGDVWGQVADLRPGHRHALPTGRAGETERAMRRLMTADTRTLTHPGGPLATMSLWSGAFQQAGSDLAMLGRVGALTRGLRAVLTHHVIFHANRAGLPAPELATLATLASNLVFNTDDTRTTPAARSCPRCQPSSQETAMTTVSDDRSATSADDLRHALTDRLLDVHTIRTPLVEAAFRRVSRELFLPGVPVAEAYANTAVYTKTTSTGVSISAASQPTMVAQMLEQLAAQPGHRVLELGAGTGYNAALLATVVGDTGHVTTIDVDEDLVDGAREHLTAARINNVDVVRADGALGHPSHAPHDRIIATVGAFEIPAAWLDQLAADGRLVVPLRLRGTNSRSIAFERREDRWVSVDSQLAVFMPLRGIGDDARRIVPVTAAGDVTLQVHKDQDVDADQLAGVLDQPGTTEWTGVLFPGNVPFEWLDLWLCLHLPNALMRMNTVPAAVERGCVSPMFGWGAMATTHGADLAYFTLRPAPPASDGEKLYEIGLIGHGPTGDQLAHRVADETRTWDTNQRGRTACFEIPDTPESTDPAAGRYVLDRPQRPITVIWE